MMKYELAVFDMDGTILNTLEDLTDATNHILKKHGYPERSLAQMRQAVGNGAENQIAHSLPEEVPEAEKKALTAEYKAYYAAHCAVKTRPYDGITKLLQTLRTGGMRTAVVSNKPDAAVRKLCETYFPGCFDLAAGAREGMRIKPSPDVVNAVLTKLSVPRERAVYIGDSEVDIATAANAGIFCIIVGWGFRDAEFLRSRGARTIVSSPAEIAGLTAG